LIFSQTLQQTYIASGEYFNGRLIPLNILFSTYSEDCDIKSFNLIAFCWQYSVRIFTDSIDNELA